MQENQKDIKVDGAKDKSDEKPKVSFWASKKIKKFFSAIHSPTAIGIYVVLAFTASAFQFYKVRAVNEQRRTSSNMVFKAIEWLDQKTMDARFGVRGEIAPEAPVALLAVDDRSIEEVGRWPWSREKTAEVVQKMMDYGAKAVGFDIVFSEPQVDPTFETLKRIETQAAPLPLNLQNIFTLERQKGQPDQNMAATFSKNTKGLVLGAFYEEGQSYFRPYQDYCRNAAFKRANSEKFVKLTNISFIVNDEADPFIDLDFDNLFDQIFPLVDKEKTEELLKNRFKRKSVSELSDLDQRKLKYLLEENAMSYCNDWLTDSDKYLIATEKIYLEIFKKSKDLASLGLEEAIKKFMSLVKYHPVVQHTRWTINTDQLQENADYTASFNAEQDEDGAIRKASLFFRTGNKLGISFVPSLALQTYLVATGYRADVEINNDPKDPAQKIISKFVIKDPSKDPEIEIGSVPVDEQGRMQINYAGGRNMYAYLPARELFSDSPDAEIIQAKKNEHTGKWEVGTPIRMNKKEFISGKSFIFGATATGVYDLRVTPFEKNYPGPETHVSALGNLFQRNFIQTHPMEERYMLSALLILGLALAIALAATGAILGFAITAASGASIFFLDKYLFKLGISATTALPALQVITLYVVLTFYKYFTEERKKKQIRSTFSKYVSPAIVDEILKDPDNVNLGGKRLGMTVFFSDLRNFTTISEKLQPTELSDVLNLYLTPMTQIVFANKGTLDKYIGDAVMAFFGAPVSFPDHAAHACRCALASMARLPAIREDINRQFPGKNIPIEIGIGINTADVSVGNMGSDIVRSYTVMGDGVNLASRLEGITKEYGVKIVISEFTYADIKDLFTCRELDWVRVKGKYKPVTIYELINEGSPTPEWIANLTHYNQAFALYHEKRFVEAKAEFEKALASRAEDAVSKLYIGRCEDYIQEPPATDWDGVYVFTKK